jgi:hypothetical protein
MLTLMDTLPARRQEFLQLIAFVGLSLSEVRPPLDGCQSGDESDGIKRQPLEPLGTLSLQGVQSWQKGNLLEADEDTEGPRAKPWRARCVERSAGR